MLYAAVVGLSFFMLAYTIRILRAPFYSIAIRSVGIVDALLSKMPEDDKVKLVQTRNNKLVVSLFQVIGVVLIAIVIGSIPLVIYHFYTGEGYEGLDLKSTSSLIALTVGSSLGFVAPLKKKNPNQAYSELSQLLHRIALNHYALSYRLFKMEKKNLGKRKVDTKKKFLIVSGLARAGTTSLMNKLVSNPALDSLSYANMPFITAPNYWSKIYKPKDTEKKERSHKDGIMIGLDSFEALEEYFFKMLAQDSYIRENSLDKYELSEVDKDDYLTYQAVVRSNNDNTYLAKNNNFLLRYESLRETNKEFVVVFMYREPLSHAASLLQKHKEFSKDQEEDGFVLEYMDWLGHHEFGLHHKPFQFEGSLEFETKDQMSLDYWLEVWINYYSYLLTIDRQNTLFIDYDEYCNQPKKVIESVLETMKITDIESEYSPFNNQRKVDYSYSTTLYSKAGKLYAELKSTGRKDH